MKTTMRVLALLLTMALTVGLLGCEMNFDLLGIGNREQNQQSTNQIEGTDNSFNATETVTIPNETTELKPLGEPGSEQLPAVELFQLTYGQIAMLDWDKMEWEDLDNGTWMCRMETADGTGYCFVFPGKMKDADALPNILTVDDLNYTSRAYITAEIQLGSVLQDLSEEIQNEIRPMDGGLLATSYLEGIYAEMLFDEPMRDIGDAYLYCVQLRQEG